MAGKYLDDDGVLYLWSKVKGHVSTAVSGKADAADLPTKTSDLTNDSNFVADSSYVHTDNNYTTAEKNKLSAFGSASDYALKSDITNAYRYKGSVAAVSNLPASGNTAGDVWNVEANGMNYAWTGSAWDALGETFSITAITNAELDTICV